MALALLNFGCGAAIMPPAGPADPVTVYLLDHGRHPTLLLPTDGMMIRYGYGDWEWYAMEKTGVFHAISALCWPTQGALGRRELDAQTAISSVRVHDPFDHIYPIVVARSDADRLRGQLDGIYQVNLSTLHENSDYDMAFVHHPQPYDFCHNSNHIMAGWLRQLGCSVKGMAFFSDWKINPPPTTQPANRAP